MKNNAPMSFTDFSKYIAAAEKDFDYMDNVSDAMQSDVLYENLHAPYALLDLLSDLFEDEEELIDIFAFNYNFGKSDGVMMDDEKDDESIQVNTISNLYVRLLKNWEKKHG